MSGGPEVTARTALSPVRAEIEKIKGSRFIADLSPVGSDTEAMGFVEEIERREPSATHHAWAYRLVGGRHRSSDDGEPTGTAGAPLNRRLEGAGLADVIVVVTRHYGGINLGRGGLSRAYGRAAQAVIEAADSITIPLTTSVRLVFPYDLTGVAEAAISAYEATVADATYAGEVTLELRVPVANVEPMTQALAEASAGKISVHRTVSDPQD